MRALPRDDLSVFLGVIVLSQTGLHAARPLLSYRTIALGGGGMEVGVVAVAFGVISLLAAVPLGRLSDRTGDNLRLLATGTLLNAASAGLLALSPTIAAVVAASSLLGLGQILMMVGVQGHVAQRTPPHLLDARFGWMSAAITVGQLVGPLVVGAVLGAGAVGTGSTAAAAGVSAGVAVLAGPLAVLLSLCSGRTVVPSAPRTSSAPSLGALQLLGRPGIKPALLASLALLTAVDILIAYLPMIAEERGIPAGTVGVLLAIRGLGSFLSRVGLGLLVDRFGHRFLIGASTLGSAVALGVLALPTDHVAILVPACLLGGALLGIGQPLTMTLVVHSVPRRVQGTALALRLTSNRVGQVAVPALAAIVTGALGAGGALWVTAAMLVLAGLVSSFRPPVEL